MKNSIILSICIALLMGFLSCQHITEKLPNIIIIMSDDMGYSDIGCYGSEISTPNLDKLAAEGLKFTQFYNTARCCPTRASLLTGLYPHQAGMGWMTRVFEEEGYRGEISKNCVTIAEVLKPAGYSNYMFGKWHVAHDIAPDGPKYNWPLQRGFDNFYGIITGAASFWDPYTLTRNNTQITPENDSGYQPETYYFTDAISDNAVKNIKDHSGDNPFFMYVAYTAAHWPMHAHEKDIAKYRGYYDKGWDDIRAKRYKKMIDLGLIDEKWALSPPDNDGWENVENKEWQIRRMEVYAAMIDIMDQGIGRIVQALKDKGELDNTLIMFLQDNGGCAEENGSRGPVEPENHESMPLKPLLKDELQPFMHPKYTRDGRVVLSGEGVLPGPDDTFVAYGKQWANVSNTPFREYKHWVHEGGISTPLIVHWPDGFDAKGEYRKEPGHLIDLMATCVDVAGAVYPEQYDGQDIIPMEGKSLVPVFEGRALDREAIYWEHESNRAIRMGKWKLVSKGQIKGGLGKLSHTIYSPWELYDLEADRSELNDLSAVNPGLVKKLAGMWTDYANRAKVYPMPWPEKQ